MGGMWCLGGRRMGGSGCSCRIGRRRRMGRRFGVGFRCAFRSSRRLGRCESMGSLESSPEHWDGWPHRCSLILDVLVGPATLTLTLRVVNHGDEPLSFTGALHTYLTCDDITTVAVSGLDGRKVHSGGTIDGDITFGDGQHDVDLAVLDADRVVVVKGLSADHASTMLCAQTGFGDVVVWNVGQRLAASMSDLGPDQWRNFVCVEAAAVGLPVTVHPSQSWTGSQTLVVLP
jgi:glucose-6-phosphate 1-epimerase